MAINKEQNKLNVPHLRFPEFHGEWEKCKLGELAVKVGSGSTPKGGNAVYTTSGHCFVRSQNVGMGHLILNDIAYIDESTHQKQKSTELRTNDVLLNITGASIGRTALATEEINGGNVNQHVCIIRTNGNVEPSYICDYIQTSKIQKYIQSLQTGGSREGLNFEQIRSFPINIPTVEEQVKIAKLLSLINERIATQSKLIEMLESLIKGIRHNIFKDILGEVLALSNIADIYQPQTISSSDLTTEGYWVYGANGIIGKYKEYNHETEQICITCRGNTCGTVNYTRPKVWITGNSMVINTDKYQQQVNKRFLLHYLSSYNFKSIVSGSGQPQIVRTPLEKIKVVLPTIEKQVRIANSIDIVSEKINTESSVLKLLENQKQYLLRQMFI